MQYEQPPTEGTTKFHLVYLVAVLLSVLLGSILSTEADATTIVPDEYRIGRVVSKFDDTWQAGAVFKLDVPRRLRASYLELTLGAISETDKTRPFASLGPVWQIQFSDDRLLAKIGFAPTLIAGSTFGDRDMGGNVHFTSSAAIQFSFGRQRTTRLTFQVQHTSNGGLSSQNPGMDITSIAISNQFGQ